MKKKQDHFQPMRSAATGLAGVSLITAVGSGIASKAPAGTPNLSAGFSTLAGFAPIATTAYMGKAVLSTLPKQKKNKMRY